MQPKILLNWNKVQMTSLTCTGGSRLSQIFWEHENLSGLSVIWLISTKIYIKLYKEKENKILAKNPG